MIDPEQAIAVMLEKHGIACDLMHGFKWDKWTSGKPAERLALLPAGQKAPTGFQQPHRLLFLLMLLLI